MNYKLPASFYRACLPSPLKMIQNMTTFPSTAFVLQWFKHCRANGRRWRLLLWCFDWQSSSLYCHPLEFLISSNISTDDRPVGSRYHYYLLLLLLIIVIINNNELVYLSLFIVSLHSRSVLTFCNEFCN